PYPTVHKGGINAVAIATPKITLAIVPLFVLATINPKPPNMAIKTSNIVGYVRAISSGVSLVNGDSLRYRNAVQSLKEPITPRFIKDRRMVTTSFMATETPMPTIRPTKGEISIAPITTAALLTLRPMEAMKMEKINIQTV